MSLTDPVNQAERRLAQHYLVRLRAANAGYGRGHEQSIDALAMLDRDWAQIQRWQRWAAAHAGDDLTMARLCASYALAGEEILLTRQLPGEWREWLEAGLAASTRLGDRRAEIACLIMLARVHHSTGSPEQPYALLQRGLALAEAYDQPMYVCKALILLGDMLYRGDDYDGSRLAHERALAIARHLGAKTEIGLALNGLGNNALTQSDLPLACQLFSEYRELSEQTGRPHLLCVALFNLSVTVRRMGFADRASAYARECLSWSQSIGYRLYHAKSLGLLGTEASAQNELAAARACFEESLAVARPLSNGEHETFVLNQLGTVACELGDFSAALTNFEDAFATAKRVGDKWYAAQALMKTAEVYRAQGDLASACSKFRDGLEVVRSFNNNATRTKYLLQAAALWCDLGEPEQAARWLGFVLTHRARLSAEQLRQADRLTHILRASLGRVVFVRVLRLGETIDLDDEIETLFILIDSQVVTE
jgi:tetratricopeptide (TPR) repeat protein